MIVYIPIFALTGVEGKMFHPMAFTVVTALLGAIILSITFVPAAVALFLSGDIRDRESKVVVYSKQLYLPMLNWALRNQALTITLAVTVMVLSGLLATRLGSEFVPSLNEGDIALHAIRIPGTSLTTAIEMQNELEEKIKTFAEVERVFSKIGTAEIATDPMPPSVADIFIILKDQDEWEGPYKTKAELIAAMERAVSAVPGNNYEFTQPIQMRFNELISGVRADVAIKVFGDNMDVLHDVGDRILSVIETIPGAADAKIEQLTGLPMLSIRMDRVKMARYGLNVSDVQNVIAIAVGGLPTGLIYEGDRRFNLVVRLPEQLRGNIDALKRLPVQLPNAVLNAQPNAAAPPAAYLTLGDVVSFDVIEGPNQISRENGKRRVVISANVRGSDLGSFVHEAQSRIASEVQIPSGYWVAWGGQYEQLVSATERLVVVVPVALGLIFMLLYLMFGNLRDGLLVFTGVPFALSGGILALWLRDIPFSISAAVGFIALSGIAVLNGLVLLTFIRNLREQNYTLEDAVKTGALTRLRPVLMTGLTDAIGFVPMALAVSIGAEVQRPLATVVIGGILTSTALTMLVLPVLYQIVGRVKVGGKQSK
jgi:cobalt-zinc-cadmium resistance protein CzcA